MRAAFPLFAAENGGGNTGFTDDERQEEDEFQWLLILFSVWVLLSAAALARWRVGVAWISYETESNEKVPQSRESTQLVCTNY